MSNFVKQFFDLFQLIWYLSLVSKSFGFVLFEF